MGRIKYPKRGGGIQLVKLSCFFVFGDFQQAAGQSQCGQDRHRGGSETHQWQHQGAGRRPEHPERYRQVDRQRRRQSCRQTDREKDKQADRRKDRLPPLQASTSRLRTADLWPTLPSSVSPASTPLSNRPSATTPTRTPSCGTSPKTLTRLSGPSACWGTWSPVWR